MSIATNAFAAARERLDAVLQNLFGRGADRHACRSPSSRPRTSANHSAPTSQSMRAASAPANPSTTGNA